MKRCPQCEFIYEDEQNCCDMDGIDLVFDESTLPGTRPAPRLKLTARKFHRTGVLSILGVVLGVVVLAIGYASLERAVSQSSAIVPTQDVGAMQQPAPEPSPQRPLKETPTDEKANAVASPEDETTNSSHKAHPSKLRDNKTSPTLAQSKQKLTLPVLPRASVQTKTTKTFIVAPQPRVAATGESRTVPAKPQAAPSRKDSKVVSIMKKTGRILSKPFRL